MSLGVVLFIILLQLGIDLLLVSYCTILYRMLKEKEND